MLRTHNFTFALEFWIDVLKKTDQELAWGHLWERADDLCDVFLCFCRFSIRCPWTGVVLDYVHS